MTISYSNRYGTLELEPVSDYQHVSTYRHKDVPDEFKYPMDTIEQLVLISENHRLQTCFGWPLTMFGFVLVHRSPAEAALCRIGRMEFIEGVNAREALASYRNVCHLEV